MTFFVLRTKPVDDLVLPALAAFTFPVNESLNWPSVSGAPLLAHQDMRLCPVICSRMCDDLGRRWPPRMNEGLRYGRMNSSPIFTTAEAVHDRRLPTGQPLCWNGISNTQTSQRGSRSMRIYLIFISGPPLILSACILSIKSRLIWAHIKQ